LDLDEQQVPESSPEPEGSTEPQAESQSQAEPTSQPEPEPDPTAERAGTASGTGETVPASEAGGEGEPAASEGSGPVSIPQPAPAVEPAPAPTAVTRPAGAPVLVPTPAPSPEPEPALLLGASPLASGRSSRYRSRFAAVYLGLGAVLAAAIVGLVILVVKPSVQHASTPWSSWRPPSGSTAQVETAIANHVAAQYHLTRGGDQLVGVVAEAPAVTSGTHKVTISAIAVRKTPNSDNGIAIYPTSNTWTAEFCGLGPACAISSGQATVQRGRLVRREALEVALYTFKFAPAVSSLVTFMPPPPGEAATELLYFQKSDLTQQLSEPLDKTLPLTTPPTPSSPDALEAATIDKLTLPEVYSYSLTQLQDGSAALVLDPVLS
jgi:hypothetical protein